MEVVTDLEEAMAEGSPLAHEGFGTNEAYTWDLSTGDIDEAFSRADVTVKGRYLQPRLIPNAIETRGVVANPDPVSGGFTVYTSTQVPHITKAVLSSYLGVPEQKLRLVAPEVAADSEGKILGMKVNLLADMGAYLHLNTAGIPLLGAFMYPGVYTFPAYSFECIGVYTNKTPTDAYRGAGRPEAAYAVERIMDALASEIGIDPAEVRVGRPRTARHRVLHLHRDLRPRPLAGAHGHRGRRGRLGDGEGPDARFGQGRGHHGHDAPRAGPRHQLVPDSGRRPGRRRRRRRGPARRHGDSPVRPRHLRLAQPPGRGRRRPHGGPEGRREGQEVSGPHARGGRGRPRVRWRQVRRRWFARPERHHGRCGRGSIHGE